ncbi:hypothetical protein [Mesorhizobium sp. 1B3]|uniref:hypothetical protein n=1 Tax=Mesorhizobium sp. 1B3 TaxID=3243599 RepID=UPI003D993BFF
MIVMTDEQYPFADELEAPAIEADEPIEPGLENHQEEQAEPVEEFEVIEFDGKQYQVPAALKGGFLMQADYTRKTQELAEQRRGLEDVASHIRQQAQAGDEEITSRAALVALDTALEQYAQLDWNQLAANDPSGAQQHWMRYQTLKEQRGQLAEDLHHRQGWRTQMAQQETARRFEETQDFARRHIKGWSPELDLQIIEFARSKGATDQNLRDAMSPLVYNLLHLARIGEQALNKATAPKALTARTARPLSMVGGRSSPSAGKSLHDMSMEEYAEHRTSQMRRGR